jgi:hypothetical protein
VRHMDIKIEKVAHHRNGISGNGFYVILFNWREDGATKTRNMIGIIFHDRGDCAVLDVDETGKNNIEFAMGNSWRGDHFEADLRKAIAQYEKEETAKFNAIVGKK